MATELPVNGASATNGSTDSFTVKTGLARMLQGGVIMDVVNAEQARIAEEAGACAVMALERVPADIRVEGGVARMSALTNPSTGPHRRGGRSLRRHGAGACPRRYPRRGRRCPHVRPKDDQGHHGHSHHPRIAEEAGACAVMALERVPADIRVEGGVARMSDPRMIKDIMATVTIPVMAKARIGHFVECQILEAIGVDYIDESEVLTPADHKHHVEKHPFTVPFVCGCRNLGEALRRISEGAAMIRTKGEAGTGDVVEAVRHMRTVNAEIAAASRMSDTELRVLAKEIAAPFELLKETAKLGRLPVVNFAAGGVATPADAALMMQLGCDGVFVGSGIFKSGDAAKRARAIVQAVTHFKDAKKLAEISEDLGEAMVGINVEKMPEGEKMAGRGW
ncbi:hypothetical protein V495_01569 [Pseudogymnoascus sp. VKM F-4514 (FW-929)]|nr:hypothetical protein V495_01569 [Pseudogymnoascus sp. VKM F-4514 (FW-929)]